MAPARSCSTCCAEVGDGRPDVFADGAASGTPAAAMSARATGWAGMRTAMVARPAVTAGATSGLAGSSSVSGPGQNAATRRW
jgi:hypothetical protein